MNESTSPRRFSHECFLAVGIVLTIVASRLVIDLPNFKPVMAIALFSGFLFQRQVLGAFAITLGMLLADSLVGFYEWQVAIVVYGALLTPIMGGWALRRWQNHGYKLATGIIGFSGLAAFNFYLLTTLAVWAFTSWYPTTWAGLGTAFAMGLPFVKWTLMGNTVFAILIFGGWSLVKEMNFLPAKQTARVRRR